MRSVRSGPHSASQAGGALGGAGNLRQSGHTLKGVNHNAEQTGDVILGIVESIDSQSLERPPSQQGKIYEEQRRQAKWAFNICVAFAILGIFQVLVGLGYLMFAREPGVAMPAGLFASGGMFGSLFNWGSKLNQSANRQLERITSHEKARDLINSISDTAKRDQAISTFAKALFITRSKVM